MSPFSLIATDKVGLMNQFPKASRLSKRDEFRNSLDCGEKIVDRFIVIRAVATDRSFPRLGIIATRKFGNAVVRNRFKRQIRESFRSIKNDFGGFDIVIIGRKDAAEATSSDLQLTMMRGFKRLEKRLQK